MRKVNHFWRTIKEYFAAFNAAKMYALCGIIYQTGEQEGQEFFRILCVCTVNKATAPDAALSHRLYGGALSR